MANVTTFETRFSKRMQVQHYKKDVFRAFASFEERSLLKTGQSVVRPYRSTLYAADYTRGSDMTFQDTTDTNETLTVTTAKVVPFTVDDLDALQSNYMLEAEYARDAAKVLGNQIDGAILSEVANAVSVIDDGTFGGSSGTPLTLSTANVLSVFSKATQKLNEQNIDVDDRFAALSPQFMNVLEEYAAGRETPGGDMVGMNGFTGRRQGYDLYQTNAAYWTGVLGIATQPTDADTVVINGVTFTFKTTLGSTPGNVLIGASADAANANLTAAINAASGAGSTYVELSTANRNLMSGITATSDTSANTVTLAVVGKSYIAVSETLTATSDTWSKLTQHNLFGRKKCIDVVIQKEPTVIVSDIPKQLGKYVKPHTLFGKKTFREGTYAMVDVKINTATF